MTLTKEDIERDLAFLGHGGSEAITLFMEMGRCIHEVAGEDGLRSWVTVALHAIPDSERIEVVTALFGALLERPA